MEALVRKKHGCALRVQVERQQQESMHFMALFNRGTVVHRGTQEEREKDAKARLFRIHAWQPSVFTRAVEEDCNSRVLCPRDCFLLKVPFEQGDGSGAASGKGVMYVWLGAEADEALQRKSVELGNHKVWGANFSVQRVEQGREPKNFFWRTLNVTDPATAYDANVGDISRTRFFHCHAESGEFVVLERSHHYCQDLLNDEGMSIVYAANRVFVWVGPFASDVVQKLTLAAAAEFAERQTGSSGAMERVLKGREPFEFCVAFQGWQHHLNLARDLARPLDFLGHVQGDDYQRQCYEQGPDESGHQVLNVSSYVVTKAGARKAKAPAVEVEEEEEEEEAAEEESDADEPAENGSAAGFSVAASASGKRASETLGYGFPGQEISGVISSRASEARAEPLPEIGEDGAGDDDDAGEYIEIDHIEGEGAGDAAEGEGEGEEDEEEEEEDDGSGDEISGGKAEALGERRGVDNDDGGEDSAWM